jgi:protein ECT2
MEEMRQLIGKRQTEYTPSSRPHSAAVPNPSGSNISDSVRSVDDLLSDADKDLARALDNYECLQNGLTELTSEFKQVSWGEMEFAQKFTIHTVSERKIWKRLESSSRTPSDSVN